MPGSGAGPTAAAAGGGDAEPRRELGLGGRPWTWPAAARVSVRTRPARRHLAALLPDGPRGGGGAVGPPREREDCERPFCRRGSPHWALHLCLRNYNESNIWRALPAPGLGAVLYLLTGIALPFPERLVCAFSGALLCSFTSRTTGSPQPQKRYQAEMLVTCSGLHS